VPKTKGKNQLKCVERFGTGRPFAMGKEVQMPL